MNPFSCHPIQSTTEKAKLTERWNGVRRRRQSLASNEQEHDERQQDGDLEVDLLPRR